MKISHGTLSKRDRARLSQASKVASVSDCKYKHGVVIVRGGRVLSIGTNSYRNYPMDFNVISKEDSSVHAEEAALRALNGEAKGAIMFVARVNNMGIERMSRPCKRCMSQIRAAGIKRIVYTMDTEIELD